MSARDRLAGKTPAREPFSVQVADPTAAIAAVEEARSTLMAAKAVALQNTADAPSQAVQEAQDAYDGALAALRDCYETVWFAPMQPKAFEALLDKHQTSKGELDRVQFRADLAAQCAEDPELQDVAWWAEQLQPDDSTWSAGEIDALYALLWSLNYSVPRSGLGKG